MIIFKDRISSMLYAYSRRVVCVCQIIPGFSSTKLLCTYINVLLYKCVIYQCNHKNSSFSGGRCTAIIDLCPALAQANIRGSMHAQP